MLIIPRFATIVLFILISFISIAQNPDLKKMDDGNWIEYLVPSFITDVTTYGDNFTPHYTRYDFETDDKKVKIHVLINNSTNSRKEFHYNLKRNNMELLNRRDLRVENNILKADKYFLSGHLTNGKIFYEFAYTQLGYGYTYNLVYDKSFEPFFKKNLNAIIKGFKILWSSGQ